MNQVYKFRIYRIILNLIFSIAAGALVAFVADFFVEIPLSIFIGAIIALLGIYLLVIDNLITLTVTDQELIYQKGSKTKTFQLKDCSFTGQTKTSSGETSCRLTVHLPNHSQELIDCDLIGIRNFRLLLDNLGVTGQKSVPIKLKTKIKE